MERLIPEFKRRGLRVSVVKHAHHRFDIDHPGKDSWRHRQAGAFEVVIASDRRLALMRELTPAMELSAHDLIAELDENIDWVMVEGFRHSNLPKVEIWRAVTEKPTLYPNDVLVLAVATDSPQALSSPPPTVLDLNDTAHIVTWLLKHGERFAYPPQRNV